MNTSSIITLLIIVFTVISSSYATCEQPKTGGQCDYKRYHGQAEIVSINEIRKSSQKAHELYEIEFIFRPDREIKEDFAKPNGKTFTLLLNNSHYPGIQFLEKYAIEVGKIFECYLKVITRGSCTPMLFEFPSINLDDNFEK